MKLLMFLLFVISLNSNLVAQGGWVAQTIGNKNYLDINFINQTTGFIIRKDSIILKTTNAGNNWITLHTGISSQASSITCGYFTTENLGALGVLGGVYRTTNGGLNWNFGNTPLLGIGGSVMVEFKNNMTGYACGSDFWPFPIPSNTDGVFWKTTNGGNSWFEILRVGAFTFDEFKIFNQDTMAVLASYRIYYTTNGGSNWTYKEFLLNPALGPNSFTNPYKDTIFIAGSGGIIRSTDSGNTWLYSLLLPQSNDLNKIYFYNSRTGYVIGETGQIYYTSNAGNNWIIQNSNTTANLNSVWFTNKDTGFAIGDNGIVLKTFTGGLLEIELISSTIPDKYYLFQNYPNPFNPKTTIRFNIAKTGITKIKVYNILGKELETLINKQLNRGEYQVTWNGNNYSSGVYYYVLEAKNTKLIKKMILVK